MGSPYDALLDRKPPSSQYDALLAPSDGHKASPYDALLKQAPSAPVAGSPASGIVEDEEAEPVGGPLAAPAAAVAVAVDGFVRGDAKLANFGPGDAPKTKAEAKERAKWEKDRQLAEIGRERRSKQKGGPVDLPPGSVVPAVVNSARYAGAVAGNVGEAVAAFPEAVASLVTHPIDSVEAVMDAVTREVSPEERKLLEREAKITGTTVEGLLEKRRKDGGVPARRPHEPKEDAWFWDVTGLAPVWRKVAGPPLYP